jgi:endonuclease G
MALVSSRKQVVIATIVVVLLAAALITAVILVLMQERGRPASSPAVTQNTTTELRIYGGLPSTANYGHPVIVLTNIGYLSGYCEAHRNPAWVGFSLNSITVGSTAKRPPKFFTDNRTASRVAHEDYTNSGYDRGHMAPNYAIATRYGNEAQRETFLLSNITPQAPNLNRIWWRLLEEKEANDFAMRLERVWVLTGPVFSGEVKKLRGGVDVPAACYRIILDEENGQPRVLAFIAPQTVTGHEPLTQFLTSVREIERQTGLDFYPELPREVQDRMESAKAERLW